MVRTDGIYLGETRRTLILSGFRRLFYSRRGWSRGCPIFTVLSKSFLLLQNLRKRMRQRSCGYGRGWGIIRVHGICIRLSRWLWPHLEEDFLQPLLMSSVCRVLVSIPPLLLLRFHPMRQELLSMEMC